MTENIYSKLVPEPTPDSMPYWKGLNEGRLLLAMRTVFVEDETTLVDTIASIVG